MAVGRRKRFGGGALAGVATTIITAGAAPADGSAAMTVTITLCNTSGGSINPIVSVQGNYVYDGILTSANTVGAQVTIGPFDLMGGEIIAAQGTGGYWTACGVEAKDV